MGILKRISNALIDPRPERDETHAATRYAMMQPELVPDLPEPQETWEQKARAYIKEHPASIEWMINKALEIKADFGWCNMKNVADEFRRSGPRDGKKSKYTWNNNFTTYVGDYIMEQCPSLRGCFATRKRSPKTRKVLA